MIPPTSIELERSVRLSVGFEDGAEIAVPIDLLRSSCPCADCRGVRDRGDRPGRPDPVALDAELHGSYGLSIVWDDGHRTGIYSWELLRQLGGIR
jgi:DUF971 family protein